MSFNGIDPEREAEQAVIGIILLMQKDNNSNKYLREARATLKYTMFKEEPEQKIFKALCDAQDAGENPDVISVSNRIKDSRYLEYMKQCIETVPTISGWRTYLSNVINNWRKRTIKKELFEILEGNTDADDMMRRIQATYEKQRNIVSTIHNSSERGFIEAVVDMYKNLFKEDTSIKTGMSSFDYVTGGLQRGGLYVIGGRPGDGKSDFSVMLATKISKKSSVTYISLEMSIEQITQRIISRVCRIPAEKLRDRNLSEEDYSMINRVVDAMENLRLVMDDTSPVGLQDVEKKISDNRPDCIVIDYLGLMKMSGKKDNWQEIGEITHSLKAYARKYDCVIILLSQVNRESEKKKTPTIADLRGSADIEADADAVFIMKPNRTEEIVSGDMSIETDLIIAKNRHGSTGKLKYAWQPQYHNYMEIETRYD